MSKRQPNMMLDGARQLADTLKAMVTTLEPKETAEVMLRGARIIAKEARKRVRRKTGNLRKALRAKKSKKRSRTYGSAYAAVDRKKAPHAHLIERGTVHAPAYPFLGPAAVAKEPEVIKTINRGLAWGLESIVKKRKYRIKKVKA